jgi:hypothetical protein
MMTNRADVTGSGDQPLDVWHVRLANGETRALSLDELDRAFNEGWVDERTLVLRAGAIRWVPLGEIAGLDDAPEPEPEPAPYSIAPFALDTNADFEVQLDNLRTEDSLADLAGDPEPTFVTKKRVWPKILKVVSIAAVVGVLGFVGFRQRAQIQDGFATVTGKKAAAAAQAAAAKAEAVTAAAKAKAEADAKAKAEADARAKAKAKAEADAKAEAEAKAKADAAIPTLNLASLPTAKGVKGVKPAPAKRR